MKPLHVIPSLILALLLLAAETTQCPFPTPTPGTPTATMPPTSTCEPTADCLQALAPLWTVVVEMEATQAAIETLSANVLETAVIQATLIDDLDDCCGECGDALDLCRMTATAAAPTMTATPTATPEPTPTEEPTPAPITDKMCTQCTTSADCGDGYMCMECGDGLRCVRRYYPQSDCNGCLWLEWAAAQ